MCITLIRYKTVALLSQLQKKITGDAEAPTLMSYGAVHFFACRCYFNFVKLRILTLYLRLRWHFNITDTFIFAIHNIASNLDNRSPLITRNVNNIVKMLVYDNSIFKLKN